MSQISRFITGANALDIVADSGTGSPQNDTLEVLGGTNVTTSISGNTVTINSSGGVTSPTFEGDGGGTASPSSGVLQMAGGTNLTTSASGDTVTFDVDGNVSDSFPADSGTATPSSGVLEVFGGTNVTTSGSGNTITIDASSTGTTSFEGDGGGTATPSGGTIQIDGGLNITSSASGDTVTLDLDQTLINMNAIELNKTDTTGSVGVISMANANAGGSQERIIHCGDNSSASGLQNFFAGAGAGSFTASGTLNTGVGKSALQLLAASAGNTAVGNLAATGLNETSGGNNIAIGFSALRQTAGGTTARSNNTAVGTNALRALTDNTNNVACGTNTLRNLIDGTNNIAIGAASGFNLSGSEANNIYIANLGTAGDNNTIYIGNDTDHSSTFIAGVQGVTPSGTNEVMIIDNNNQLGSQTELSLGLGGTGIDASGATDGQLLIGGTASNDLQLNTLTGGNNLTVTNGTNSITLDVDGAVADSFPTDSGTATPSSGSLTIAGGTNVTTSGSGSTVTIDATTAGGNALVWQTQSTNITMSVNNGYIPSGTSGVLTLTLPATAAIGERVAIAGYDADGWSIAQNSGQTIHFGDQDTTTGTGGSLSSNQRYDAIELICVVTDTDWVVRSSIGNITVT